MKPVLVCVPAVSKHKRAIEFKIGDRRDARDLRDAIEKKTHGLPLNRSPLIMKQAPDRLRQCGGETDS